MVCLLIVRRRVQIVNRGHDLSVKVHDCDSMLTVRSVQGVPSGCTLYVVDIKLKVAAYTETKRMSKVVYDLMDYPVDASHSIDNAVDGVKDSRIVALEIHATFAEGGVGAPFFVVCAPEIEHRNV